MRYLNQVMIVLVLSLSCQVLSAQKGGVEGKILGIMESQEVAWNAGDINAFMQPYWQSDSLLFIGKSGVNRGWTTTLNNYKKGYPDKKAMGQLTFDIVRVDILNRKNAYVIGKWHLAREEGDLSGHYTLLWKKMKGAWVIVADHSS